jgi:hypothetical protein
LPSQGENTVKSGGNRVETMSLENTAKSAELPAKRSTLLERKVAVAPMMDGVNSWRFTFVTQLLSNPAK